MWQLGRTYHIAQRVVGEGVNRGPTERFCPAAFQKVNPAMITIT